MDRRWVPLVLEHIAAGQSLSAAARLAGVSVSTVYNARKNDDDFKAALQDAEEASADLLEAEARRRAVDGVEEPVYQGGQLVGTKRVYSDTLLALLLKGRRKDVFSDRKELTGANGAPLPPAVVIATGVPQIEPTLDDLA